MLEMLLKYCAGLTLMLGMGVTTLVSAETATLQILKKSSWLVKFTT